MGVLLQEVTFGKRPGAPNVNIWANNFANSGAWEFGPMSISRFVSRASALRFENMPSFFFGLGGFNDDDEDWGGKTGMDVGDVDFGVSSNFGFDDGRCCCGS